MPSASWSSAVVLDNGGGLLKAGFGGDRDPTAIVPNCAARSTTTSSSLKNNNLSSNLLIADQITSLDVDPTSLSLRRPIDRGYITNPDLQRDIWDRVLRSLLRVDPTTTPLLLTEPLFVPPSLARSTDELVFEDFGFPALCCAPSSSLVHIYEFSRRTNSSAAAASLVVDCGFSFTHAVPVLQNFVLNYGVKRIDLGGKALTNYMKELISYRSVNVMDQSVLIDQVKEDLCFVSLDVARDLRLARCTYVLPDGVNHTKGFVKDMEEARRFMSLAEANGVPDTRAKEAMVVQTDGEIPEDEKKIEIPENEIKLTNERFLVPEILFHPSDLGMNQAGLPECIVRAINACHPHLHPVLYDNIILTGGSTLFPQFAERLEKELRPLVPDDYHLKITTQEDPILGVWRGGSLLASSPDFESMCITKSEYEEMGSSRARHRFFH